MIKKSGLTEDNEKVKSLLSNEALKGIEVDADVAGAINSNLISFESAKANPDLRKHYVGQALSTMESKYKELIPSLGYDETEFAEELAGQNTYEKPAAIAKKIKALEEKRAAAAAGDKGAYTKQIADLNAALAAKDQKHTSEKAQLISQQMDELRSLHLQTKIAGMNLSKTIPGTPEMRLKYAIDNLNAELEKDGGMVALRENKLKLVSKTDPDMPFNIDHLPADFDTYAQKKFNDLGLLDITSPAPQKPGSYEPPAGFKPQGEVYADYAQMFQGAADSLKK